MRTVYCKSKKIKKKIRVGMKPLSERDENFRSIARAWANHARVGMKPLSERDENRLKDPKVFQEYRCVGMKPLSERDENNNECQGSGAPWHFYFVGMKPLSERDENFLTPKCKNYF